jgi:hypothetical protein
MKVVVIGGGIISNKLVSTAPVEFHLSRFTIRRLPDVGSSWNSALEHCRSANVIVYLAYHHRDLPKNIQLLQKLLSTLQKVDWRGHLVFFNTQSVLASTILKSPKPIKKVLCFDLYTTTKRLQSWLLSRCSRKLNISEIYLPVVLGLETKAQQRYESISKHKIIHLPNKGTNLFAYLDLDVFVHWFWMVYIPKVTQSTNEYRKVFIYQGLRSFAEMIGFLRDRHRSEHEVAASQNSPAVMKNCDLRFRFSDDARSNFFYGLKMTPIWLVLTVLRNAFKKLTSSETKAAEPREHQLAFESVFCPVGAEYQYFCTTIVLDAVPFDTVRIKP